MKGKFGQGLEFDGKGTSVETESADKLTGFKLGKKTGALYRRLRSAYQLEGDDEALNTARALLKFLFTESRIILCAAKSLPDSILEGAGFHHFSFKIPRKRS